MKKKLYAYLAALSLLLGAGPLRAQQGISGIHGSFQTDVQQYKADSSIGAPDVPEEVLANSFLNLTYSSGSFSAGVRYESYLNALQGYDQRYKGNGYLFRYATYTNDDLEVTAGNFYEQFGYGLIFRSYQEWGLGFDNAMDGVRLRYKPYKGIAVKGFIARQRSFFDYGPGIVRGADGEVNLNELCTSMAGKKTNIVFGGSFISKYQADDDPLLKLPENVAAYSGRVSLARNGFTFGGEYAYKMNDPSTVNNLIYKPGQALYLNTGYTKKGYGITVAAKRLDNMDFRSDRTAIVNNLNLNFLPAGSKSQTYRLATVYPYATQPNGEMGVQADVFYRFKPQSALGGHYGTGIAVNYSRITGIDTVNLNDAYGYESDFFKPGDVLYFEELNVEVTKKVNKNLKVILTYINQTYNIEVVQGLGGHGTVYDNIGIAEIQYKINRKHSVRAEFQALLTKQDKQDWAMALLEYTVSPHWFLAVFDEYNYGNDIEDDRIHYYSASFGFKKNVTRISVGYGKQREGLLCVGGVCRQVPASNGFSLSVSSSF